MSDFAILAGIGARMAAPGLRAAGRQPALHSIHDFGLIFAALASMKSRALGLLQPV